MDVVFGFIIFILAAVGIVRVFKWLFSVVSSKAKSPTSTATEGPVVERARAAAGELSGRPPGGRQRRLVADQEVEDSWVERSGASA